MNLLGILEAKVRYLFAEPALFTIEVLLIVVAIGLHEWGHAVMATMCGDPTPKSEGRLTLNPLAHLDPIGTIGILFFGFGWGKPVMVQPANFRNKRWDDVKVSAAGPAMNLFQALIFALLLRFHLQGTIDAGEYGLWILQLGLMMNLGLMVFNLIPIGPLDGAHIMKGLLPFRQAYEFHRFNQQWGMLLMFGAIMFGAVSWFLAPVQQVFIAYLTWGLHT